MSLIKCPECGKEISDTAEKCPHCGYPINVAPTKSKVPIKGIIICSFSIIIVAVAAILLILSTRLSSEEQTAVNEAIASINSIGAVTTDSESLISNAERIYDGLTDRCKKHVNNYSQLSDARFQYNTLCANEVIVLIDDIGEVDERSSNKINKAQSAYGSLTDEQKQLVTNSDRIQNAYDELIALKVKKVEDAILDIGEITIESDKAIKKARKLYDELNDDEKAEVSSIEILTNAESEYTTLAIDNCETLISQIGEVTLNSNNAINAAKRAYSALDSDQKKKVTNYNDLESAESTYAVLKEEDDIRIKTLSNGDTFGNSKWEVTFNKTTITDKILPNKLQSYYTYYYADDDETFLDLNFTIKNIDTGMLGIEDIVSGTCTVDYKGSKLNKSYGLYISSGTRIDKVYSWDGIDALDSCTLHVVIDMPRELNTNNEPVRVLITIAGIEKIVNIRGENTEEAAITTDDEKDDSSSQASSKTTIEEDSKTAEIKKSEDNKETSTERVNDQNTNTSATAEWLIGNWERDDSPGVIYSVSSDGSVTVNNIFCQGSGINIDGSKAYCVCSRILEGTNIQCCYYFTKKTETTASLTYTTSTPDFPQNGTNSATTNVTKR